MAPKNLTDDQNARLRAIVKRELCARVPAQLHLAPLLGITQASLSRFLDGQCGVGAAVALRIAFLLNRSVEDILGLERDAGLQDPQEERYPSRLLTARAAYLDGVPLTNIRAVLSSSLRFDGDPGPRWWRKMMDEGHLAKPGNKRDTDWAVSQVKVGWPSSPKRGRQPKRR
ncbi:MAG: hypothetical protein ACOY0T_26785 [Myxococcota bacterium]|jgi:plasmid maintenance system antidote protein VapI